MRNLVQTRLPIGEVRCSLRGGPAGADCSDRRYPNFEAPFLLFDHQFGFTAVGVGHHWLVAACPERDSRLRALSGHYPIERATRRHNRCAEHLRMTGQRVVRCAIHGAMRKFAATLFLLLTAASAHAETPQRVVSFNLCADQLVVSLADPGQIAALSPYARDDHLSVVA